MNVNVHVTVFYKVFVGTVILNLQSRNMYFHGFNCATLCSHQDSDRTHMCTYVTL